MPCVLISVDDLPSASSIFAWNSSNASTCSSRSTCREASVKSAHNTTATMCNNNHNFLTSNTSGNAVMMPAVTTTHVRNVALDQTCTRPQATPAQSSIHDAESLKARKHTASHSPICQPWSPSQAPGCRTPVHKYGNCITSQPIPRVSRRGKAQRAKRAARRTYGPGLALGLVVLQGLLHSRARHFLKAIVPKSLIAKSTKVPRNLIRGEQIDELRRR